MKFKKVISVISLCILVLSTTQTYNAEQVPSTTGGTDLDENAYIETKLDDINDSTDIDMFAIQNPADIIIKPTDDYSVEVIGDGWIYNPEQPNQRKITQESYTGNESIIYHNAARYYNPSDGQIEALDMNLDITDYEKGPENITRKNELTVFVDGKEADLLQLNQATNDVSFALSFIDSNGEKVKNRNVEMLWTDIDLTASVSYEKEAVQQIIAPTYDRSYSSDISNPYFYMNLQSLLSNDNFKSNIYDFVHFKSTDFSEYRLGIYNSSDMITIFDRWNTAVVLTDDVINNMSDSLYNKIISIPHIIYNRGTSPLNNTPGQNFAITVNTGDEGVINFDMGNQYEFSGKSSANGIYLASPDVANTSIAKTITDTNNNGVAEDGETLNYTVTITNNSDKLSAYLTEFKDSMIIDVPEGLSFNNDVTLEEGIDTVGDINSGEFSIIEIPAGESTTISYSFDIDNINTYLSNGGSMIDNIATDNGIDPLVCEEIDKGIDCGEATIEPNGYTDIKKLVEDENEDGIIQVGEDLTYTINIKNNSAYNAYNVTVRDSMFEHELPSYIEIGDVEINTSGFPVETKGDLYSGDFTLNMVPVGESVNITYHVKLVEQPEDEIVNVSNIVTDNGSNPEICEEEDKSLDCSETITPIEPETIISKSVSDSSEDGKVQNGETLIYTINVMNPSNTIPASNVAVRDSLLENLPDYVTYNNDVEVTPNISTSGDLTKGNFVLSQVPASTTVKISYSLRVNAIPKDISEIINLVTDDGEDPITCDINTLTEDCGGTISPTDDNRHVDPQQTETEITKSGTDESNDGIIQNGEKIDYTITVNNPSEVVAKNVVIRDSLIENTPEWMIYNDDLAISTKEEYSGSLSDGNFVITQVHPKETVKITYSFTVVEYPEDVEFISNIATDNGEEPEFCNDENKGVDCDEVIIPTEPNTVISKTVVDENEDGIVQAGETLTYTIDVRNETTLPITNVMVRDSILENLDNYEYIDYINNPQVEGSKFDVKTSGKLTKGNFTIKNIPAKSSVKINYDLKVNNIPDDVDLLLNVVTDDGEEPLTCIEEDKDCDEAIIPTEPNTIISKIVVDENEDGIVQDDETLTYTIDVRNETSLPITNVMVRDSILENLDSYEYIDYINNPQVKGSKFDVETSGELSEGNFTINKIPAKSSVKIIYDLKINNIPDDVDSLLNIVTDNGEEPLTCIEENEGIDCDTATIPTHAETFIEKKVSDENEDGVVQEGEVLNYLITVTNPTGNQINDVNIRDSLLEDLPAYLVFNNDVKVTPNISTSGDLTKGDFALDKVESNSHVEISYSLTVNEVPKKISEIINIVTDNGDDPKVCEDVNKGIDCDTAIISKEKIKLITVKEEEDDTPSMPHTGI